MEEETKKESDMTVGDIVRALGLGELYDEAVMRAEKKKAAGDKEMCAYWVGAMGRVQESAMAIHDRLKAKDPALMAYLKQFMEG